MNWLRLVLIITTCIAAVNCGRFEPDTAELHSSRGSDTPTKAEVAFANTAYPVLRVQCGTCHTQIQRYAFASNSVRDSLKNIEQFNLLPTRNPSESPLVKTIRGGKHFEIKDVVADNIMASLSDFIYQFDQ